MATMREVAAQAGVSYTTVSYVLNQRDSGRGISDATRQRVTEAATELGYRHNALARAMVEGGQRVIGLMIQDLSLEIRAQILAGVIEEANRSDYLVKVFPLTGQSVSEETLNKCLEQRLGGAIVVNVNAESLSRMHQEFSRYNMALAMVDDVSPQEWGVRVVSDDVAGVELALQHLWDLGHRRFGFVAGPTDSTVTAIRRRAYADFMIEHDSASGPIIDSSPRWDLRETDEEKLRAALLEARARPRFSALAIFWRCAFCVSRAVWGWRCPAIYRLSVTPTSPSLVTPIRRSPPSLSRFARWASWPRATLSSVSRRRAAKQSSNKTPRQKFSTSRSTWLYRPNW